MLKKRILPANNLSSTYNSKLAEVRRSTMGGQYDIHTNTMQYPQIMQPTHVRYERVPPSEVDTRTSATLMNDMSSLTIASKDQPATSNADPTTTTESNESTANEQPSIFPPVPKSFSDHYVIQDIIYESPQYSNMGIPGPDGDLKSLGPNGFVSIANPKHPELMSPDLIALLPDECKEALLETAAQEVEWKSKWSGETTDGARSKPRPSVTWFL